MAGRNSSKKSRHRSRKLKRGWGRGEYKLKVRLTKFVPRT